MTRSGSRKQRGARLAAGLALGLAGILQAPALAAEHRITVRDNRFEPARIVIAPGDTVIWTNQGANAHNVRADDNSFRCAVGCDEGGGTGVDTGYDPSDPSDRPGDPSSSSWRVVRRFDSVGDVAYFCDNHGAPGGVGMSGVIVVSVGGGAGSAGQVGFAANRVTVAEDVGSATIPLERTGGSLGAVSVSVSTVNATALAGVDFQAVVETVSWGDGDATRRTVAVPIVDDADGEGTETFRVVLSNPTGGAAIGAGSSTVRIRDDDAGAEPSAGTLLFAAARVVAIEGSDAVVSIERQGGRAGSVSVALEAGGAAVVSADYVAVPLQVSWADGDDGAKEVRVPIVLDADDEAVERLTLRLASASGGARLGAADEVTIFLVDDELEPCQPSDDRLCLGAGRFSARVVFRTADGDGGIARAVALGESSGFFTFFEAANVEAIVKVLEACPLNQRFWVFAAGLTDVEADLVIVDTRARQARVYSNPLGSPFLPVTDTAAFATCSEDASGAR